MLAAISLQPAFAGTTGTINGLVRDAQSGSPIANVKVTAVSPSQTQTTTTNAAGFYSVQALTPDTYTVSFQLPGYEPSSQPGITVQQDLVYKLDVRMTKESEPSPTSLRAPRATWSSRTKAPTSTTSAARNSTPQPAVTTCTGRSTSISPQSPASLLSPAGSPRSLPSAAGTTWTTATSSTAYQSPNA